VSGWADEWLPSSASLKVTDMSVTFHHLIMRKFRLLKRKSMGGSAQVIGAMLRRQNSLLLVRPIQMAFFHHHLLRLLSLVLLPPPWPYFIASCNWKEGGRCSTLENYRITVQIMYSYLYEYLLKYAFPNTVRSTRISACHGVSFIRVGRDLFTLVPEASPVRAHMHTSFSFLTGRITEPKMIAASNTCTIHSVCMHRVRGLQRPD
jgi:hypothetical protein